MHAHLLGIFATALDATGLFEEAEQLGLSQEVQAARQMLQQRQQAAVEALQVAATRADAAAFASALSIAWLVPPSPKLCTSHSMTRCQLPARCCLVPGFCTA